MKKELDLVLSPKEAFDEETFLEVVKKKVGAPEGVEIYAAQTRRSIDARSKKVKVRVSAEVYIEEKPELQEFTKNYPNVSGKKQVVIVGAGPAGMFAALRLIELGIKPIILERGKDVQARRRDLAALNKEHIVNPDSNYCFGEGGAGTYSDGKLYTRSKKRGDFRRVLEILVAHGATPQILIDAHPHIGTNKLPMVVSNIRESILEAGGEIHFGQRVTDFHFKSQHITGVETASGERFHGEAVVLATGHSARDIYHLLRDKGVYLENKPFALGVRVEHSQLTIDKAQYHCDERGEYLPAAAYSLVKQVRHNKKEKGVFSFCMCPGGFIVPSATTEGEVVVNGMSPSKRDSKYANSGIVVSVDNEELQAYKSEAEFAGLAFQQEIEKAACVAGGGTQSAPAQRMTDFVKSRASRSLPECSYQPGLTASSLEKVLPASISERLKVAFKSFGRKIDGYYSEEAVVVGVESRTSAPVRIPRDKETMEHIQTARLFPSGEGAGYAGGIASAAMDGERVAEAIAKKYF